MTQSAEKVKAVLDTFISLWSGQVDSARFTAEECKVLALVALFTPRLVQEFSCTKDEQDGSIVLARKALLPQSPSELQL